MESGLMSESDAQQFLGTDHKGIVRLIKQRDLNRDPVTGAFARVQVEAAHNKILRGILNVNGAEMGSEQQTVGVLNGVRRKPYLV